MGTNERGGALKRISDIPKNQVGQRKGKRFHGRQGRATRSGENADAAGEKLGKGLDDTKKKNIARPRQAKRGQKQPAGPRKYLKVRDERSANHQNADEKEEKVRKPER